MNTKLLLIAASTLAVAACGGTEVDVADDQTDGALETALSEEQPVLEGDSPFVDDADVAVSTLDEDSYDTGFDGSDLDDDALSDDAETGVAALVAESERIAAGAASDVSATLDDAASAAERRASNVAATVTDNIGAKQFTANQTDAYIGEDGELITGSEAALLSGTYNVAMEGLAGTKRLMIDGVGDVATGTFDGAPIEVIVTGRNFSFDAPVMANGEETLMTFAATFENGVIDNGVLSAEGDGDSMTFTAVRDDADTAMTPGELLDDATDAGAAMLDKADAMANDAVDAVEDVADDAADDLDPNFDM